MENMALAVCLKAHPDTNRALSALLPDANHVLLIALRCHPKAHSGKPQAA
jgi:hypothetical protein